MPQQSFFLIDGPQNGSKWAEPFTLLVLRKVDRTREPGASAALAAYPCAAHMYQCPRVPRTRERSEAAPLVRAPAHWPELWLSNRTLSRIYTSTVLFQQVESARPTSQLNTGAVTVLAKHSQRKRPNAHFLQCPALCHLLII